MAIGAAPPAAARARRALEEGRGPEAAQLLAPLLRGGSLPREDEFQIRALLAEAWLLQDDLAKASSALGRTPDGVREPLSDGLRSSLWRLHGRIAFARGEQSRAIALHSRALNHAQLAHESRAIGLAHYELALCYQQVGDSATVRDHLTQAAAALHAAGDRRHLALVHSLSGVLLAQSGRLDEALSALRQGEHLALAVHADDVLAGVVHNQANVTLLRNEHDAALSLAERSVALSEARGAGHGLAVTLATLGQILVQLGHLERAEHVLTRALEVRSEIKFHETTGAVFDTLTQIHLMRGSYDRAEEYLRQASEAYGGYGIRTMRWYEWSLRVVGIKLATRRGAYDDAVAMADELVRTPGVPASDLLHADLAAAEALVAAGRLEPARRRLEACEERLDPRLVPASWGELLRIRGLVNERSSRPLAAHHDFAQSAGVFELLGDRFQAALSHLALARLGSRTGRRASAEVHLDAARETFAALGARRSLDEAAEIRAALDRLPADTAESPSPGADEALVKRLVEAAVVPELLARETAAVLLEGTGARGAVVFAASGGGLRVLAASGLDAAAAEALARIAASGAETFEGRPVIVEPLGPGRDGAHAALLIDASRLDDQSRRRQLSICAAVARQGFALCRATDRQAAVREPAADRTLEPLVPGFICASAVMHRVAEQIHRLQGHNLTVLITGESGTGKELVARAIHAGSPRRSSVFLPYNCTTTTRELADSQLFGHRRGSFTGAVTDQQGLIRSAGGGTLFLDEIGDLPLDVQPKLLRFLEQGEIIPVGDTRPIAVDVRVLAATNADLEQRVAEGRFREDLYYRLSVIRIHVPPLRERREEIPHLSTLFLREACERLSKPEVHLSPATLELFARYWWPGNVRQLRNEIQRAVAMSAPGGAIEPAHLSPDLSAPPAQPAGAGDGRFPVQPGNLAAAVERVERELISAALGRSGGNISESARLLGLTRRGLYLKMRRLNLGNAGTDTR